MNTQGGQNELTRWKLPDKLVLYQVGQRDETRGKTNPKGLAVSLTQQAAWGRQKE